MSRLIAPAQIKLCCRSRFKSHYKKPFIRELVTFILKDALCLPLLGRLLLFIKGCSGCGIPWGALEKTAMEHTKH